MISTNEANRAESPKSTNVSPMITSSPPAVGEAVEVQEEPEAISCTVEQLEQLKNAGKSIIYVVSPVTPVHVLCSLGDLPSSNFSVVLSCTWLLTRGDNILL